MAEIKYLSGSPLAAVIDDNATLANGARAAGDYDNDTEQDLWAIFFLQVQYDTGPPAAGDVVAKLYVLPGDGAATEVFPDGGDAALGTDDDPQNVLLAATFQSVNPSLTVDEVLATPMIPLYPHGNRIVLKNVSGQTFDATWELRVRPVKLQSV